MRAASPAARALFRAALAFALAGGLIAQAPAQDHSGQYDRADIEAGSRLYSAQCAPCHGVNGDMIAGVDLRGGQFKTVVSDDDLARLLAAGRPASGMPAFATFRPSEVTGLTAFIRTGFDAAATAVKVGDPRRGQALFDGKGGCGLCHRVRGRGPTFASDLTDVGAIRTPGSLQRALLEPARSLLPANRAVRAVTRDGRTIRGRRLNEDTYTLQLIDSEERVVSLTKADLRSYEISTGTMMPSYAGTLSAGELSDLIAYLLSLKGAQP
jgi:putative heme-binding domain-containing protein